MKKRKIVLGSFVAITVLATSSMMVFATSGNTTLAGLACKGFDGGRGEGTSTALVNMTDAQKTLLKDESSAIIKDALANLVTKGVFTQAEADAMITVDRTKPQEKGNGVMQNLTDVQKTALQEKIDLLYTENLKQLVIAGTISQAQADQLALRAQRTMTGHGRGYGNEIKSYSNENTEVDNVTTVKTDRDLSLTDVQKKILHDNRTTLMKTAVAELVNEKVLTQTEADAIITTVSAEPQERGNGLVKNLTDTQRTALQSEMKTQLAAHLKELVTTGTITQAQADQLSKSGHIFQGNMMNQGKMKTSDTK